MGELTKQHRDELRPAGETLGLAFGVLFLYERRELAPWEVLQQLIEQAGGLYHGVALLVSLRCRIGPTRNRFRNVQLEEGASFKLTLFKKLFWTRVFSNNANFCNQALVHHYVHEFVGNYNYLADRFLFEVGHDLRVTCC